MLAAAENQATHCQLGDAVRVIEVVYPEGSGIFIDEDTTLLLSMHYVINPDDSTMADQTRIQFQVAEWTSVSGLRG
jgi:hypothetical protein